MEKHSNRMDLDEWEVLSDDGFFDLHHQNHNKKVLTIASGFEDYFICPSPPKKSVLVKKEEKKTEEERIIVVKEMIKVPVVEIKNPKLVLVGEDHDTISQVLFKKIKENEFVEMKLDSPTPTIEPGGSIQFEDKQETENKKIDGDQEAVKKNCLDSGMKKDQRNLQERNNGGGLHIWKWRITGIGALCSIGITAATICIFIIGNRKKHHQQNQKFRFQIYAEDNERIKQVVHHATKLNNAISAARGVPLTRAHITFGGYFDGL
ncbi:hypothetical protein C5167_027167 [Papaver somniferum]|uniref:uncharacterized protein LOC113335961 n=1 Tax=Papaver somniferum TaxID=3469 RepID=UPI000E706095|nr:uncharacterized protein LOC113335961 [Papaver somniferum]RZC89630.1 hypothetical protein C5167_027167 [Papaver somniferum]